ncbi:MAG: VWA domain-containing protein [Planctomycetota bacterium]
MTRGLPLFLLLCATALGAPVQTRWRIADDVPSRGRGLALTAEPPDGTRALDVRPTPRYASFDLAGRRYGIAVNPRYLRVDLNRDGRLDVSERVVGRTANDETHFRFIVSLPLGPGGATQAVPLQFVLAGGRMRFRHTLERAGEVELGGRLRPFVMVDGDFDLRFNSVRYDAIVLDRDGDARLQRFIGSHERVPVRDSFRLGSAGYRCDPLSPDAAIVEFTPVDAAPPAPAHHLRKHVPPPSGIAADDPGGDLAKYKRAIETKRDPETTLRAAGRIGSAAAYEFLAGIAGDAQRPLAVRAAALRGLGFKAYAQHAAVLERFATTSTDPRIRLAALDALHGAGVVGRELVFASLLRDAEVPIVVAAAAKYLACVSPRMLDPVILRLQDQTRKLLVYRMARRYARGAPSPESVLTCAASRSASLRAMALRDLFLLGHEKARDLALAAALEPGAPSAVTGAAAITLGAVGDAESIAALFDLAGRGVAPVAAEAQRLLALERRDAAVRAIATHLRSNSPHARRLAVEVLRQIPGPIAAGALFARDGNESDPKVNSLLQAALLEQAHPRIVKRLVSPIRRERDLQRKQMAIEALVRRGMDLAAVRAALIDLLDASGWETRVLVLRAIKPGPYSDLAQAVAKLLRSRIWQVRLSGAEALGQLRVRDGLEALVVAIEKEGHGRVKEELGKALTSLTGKNLRDYSELWRKWWDREGASFHVPPRPPKPDAKKGKKAETKTVATFYGVPLTATRIVFVLDRSGSMKRADMTDKKTRLARAKEELLRAVDGLPSSTRINVVFFSNGVDSWRHALVPLNKSNRAGLAGFTKRVVAMGGTNMYHALSTALNDKEVEAIYLLSDGQPTGKFRRTEEMLREIASINRIRRVQIHCIALGFDSHLLRRLAKDNDGVFQRR